MKAGALSETVNQLWDELSHADMKRECCGCLPRGVLNGLKAGKDHKARLPRGAVEAEVRGSLSQQQTLEARRCFCHIDLLIFIHFFLFLLVGKFLEHGGESIVKGLP